MCNLYCDRKLCGNDEHIACNPILFFSLLWRALLKYVQVNQQPTEPPLSICKRQRSTNIYIWHSIPGQITLKWCANAQWSQINFTWFYLQMTITDLMSALCESIKFSVDKEQVVLFTPMLVYSQYPFSLCICRKAKRSKFSGMTMRARKRRSIWFETAHVGIHMNVCKHSQILKINNDNDSRRQIISSSVSVSLASSFFCHISSEEVIHLFEFSLSLSKNKW